MDLTELDRLGSVVVNGRLQHDEERLVVAFQLRALVRLDGIFDGELMQVVLVSDGLELGVIGLVQPDPGEGARAPIQIECAVENERLLVASSCSIACLAFSLSG